MSGDGGKQLPRAKSKKRTHLSIMDTDSSDDCDAPTVKPRRKPRKTTSDSNKKGRDKSGDSQVAGSSGNVEKKAEERKKGVNKSKSTKIETTNSRDSKSLCLSDSSKKLLDNGAAVSMAVKSEEKGENSDDQSTEHCPICWLQFKDQEVAVPASCEHFFCFQCILKWTAHSNTCPVDRQTFNMIDVHENYGGKTTRQMPIETRTPQDVVTADEAIDGDNPFLIFHSNSTSPEWDLEDSEVDYDSSLHNYWMFEDTDGLEDSPITEDNVDDASPNNNHIDSSMTDETDFSPHDPNPSDYENFVMEDHYEQRASSSLSSQNESSSRCDDSNDGISEGASTTSPPPLMTLRHYCSSDSHDTSVSSIDSSSSSCTFPSSSSSSY